jgi:hypothetical protein
MSYGLKQRSKYFFQKNTTSLQSYASIHYYQSKFTEPIFMVNKQISPKWRILEDQFTQKLGNTSGLFNKDLVRFDVEGSECLTEKDVSTMIH